MGKKELTYKQAQEKFLEAFVGLVKSYKLEPANPKKANAGKDYQAILFHYENDEGLRQLYIKPLLVHKALNLLETLFPKQVDRSLAKRKLIDSLDSWITMNLVIPDVSRIKEHGKDFLKEVKSEIYDVQVYIPVYGIKVKATKPLKIANCTLEATNQKAGSAKLLNKLENDSFVDQDVVAQLKKAPATLSFSCRAQIDRAYTNAKMEAELACDVLMLFLGKYYFDTFQNPMRPRRISLGMPLIYGRDNFYFANVGKPHGKRNTAWRQEYANQDYFEIDDDKAKVIKDLGLPRINGFLKKADADETGSRLKIAITWFGKACTATTVAESFLKNSIAIEALLSEVDRRTSQERYAQVISFLVMSKDRTDLHPLMQPLSRPFAEKLISDEDYESRSKMVMERVTELLKHRNDIVHGRRSFEDALAQLDFEAIVRNSIISFVYSKWDDIKEVYAAMPQKPENILNLLKRKIIDWLYKSIR